MNSNALKKEIKMYAEIYRKLMVLKGLIQDELTPSSVGDFQAEKLIEAIDLIQRFDLDCISMLEGMIDDLENE